MRQKIGSIGIHAAVRKLLPHIVQAGDIACQVQDGLKAGTIKPLPSKNLGGQFADALTPADLQIENYLGAVVGALFADASFFGEEQSTDLISKDIPQGLAYTVTLDPVNGTKYFMDGQDCFEIILTICAHHEMIASVVYFPRRETLLYAHGGRAYEIPAKDALDASFPARSYGVPRERRDLVLLTRNMRHLKPELEAAGFRVTVPIDEYDGRPGWDQPTAGILDGRLSGLVLGRPQLIDGVAIAYVGLAAGCVGDIVDLDIGTKRAERVVLGANNETYERIRSVIGP